MVSNSSLTLIQTRSDIVTPVSLPDFSERAERSDSWRACKKQCQNGAEKDMSKVLFVSFHNPKQTEYERKLEGNVLKLPITSSLLP